MKALTAPVLAHRILLTAQARLRGETPEAVISSLLQAVAVPVEGDLVVESG